MHIDAALLSTAWILPCSALLLATVLMALRFAPWAALRAQPRRMHLVAGGAVACLALWLLNIRMIEGLILHLLGVTTLTLLLGWCLSVLATSTALLGFIAVSGQQWISYPVDWLFTVLVPASVTHLLARALYRPRLRNPFFYMLGAGFAGGALVVLVDALLGLWLFQSSGMGYRALAALEVWPLLLLVMFSEGFINGMCVSALAIFYPDWLKTFDERFYLDH